jgi:hypothetical protein
MRRIAGKLGVTVEHLETGVPTPTEIAAADAGLDFGSLTRTELSGTSRPEAIPKEGVF